MSESPSSFAGLASADLVVDRIYQGGTAGNMADDPLARLLPMGNQGGFRYKGSPRAGTVRLAVLYTTGGEPDWPDLLDVHTGQFTYYGDNRSAGQELHVTQRQGNALLRDTFESSHGSAADRRDVCPFLLFDKPGPGRDVRFRGLLAPGSSRASEQEELVAVWRTTSGVRFQNYRALFTVLNVPVVSRAWLTEVLAGEPLGSSCPGPWRAWVGTRAYQPLLAPPTVTVRTREQQLPGSPSDRDLLKALHGHFSGDPYKFEQFAADLWQASEPNVDRVDVTRPWRDGGGTRSVTTSSAQRQTRWRWSLRWRPSATPSPTASGSGRSRGSSPAYGTASSGCSSPPPT